MVSGIGKALTTSGPLSLLLGYAITGMGVYGVASPNPHISNVLANF